MIWTTRDRIWRGSTPRRPRAGSFVIDQPSLAHAFLLEASGGSDDAAKVLTTAWQAAEAVPLSMAKPTVGPQFARLCALRDDTGTPRAVAASLAALADANPDVARLLAAARWAGGLAGAGPGKDADPRAGAAAALAETVELLRRAQRFANPEIAAQLFVSRRTVETHVSHLLTKLGCTSWRDLAEAIRRHLAGRHLT